MPVRSPEYREFQPSPALRPYVECLWTLTSSSAGRTPAHRVLPDGCLDIIFNFGDPWRPGSTGTGTHSHTRYVVGTMTRPLLVEPGRRAEFLGVRFRPGKAGAFLHLSAAELTDDSAALDNFWNGASRELEQRLADLAGAEERAAALEKELLCRLGWSCPKETAVDAAVDAILRSPNRVSIQAISSQVGLSRQHLAKKFAQQVGIGPKLLARVVRFRRALRYIRRSTTVDWSAAALALGYYDQAHMISDFKQFSGLTPAQYRQNQ